MPYPVIKEGFISEQAIRNNSFQIERTKQRFSGLLDLDKRQRSSCSPGRNKGQFSHNCPFDRGAGLQGALKEISRWQRVISNVYETG
jgi:hypothetical protein